MANINNNTLNNLTTLLAGLGGGTTTAAPTTAFQATGIANTNQQTMMQMQLINQLLQQLQGQANTTTTTTDTATTRAQTANATAVTATTTAQTGNTPIIPGMTLQTGNTPIISGVTLQTGNTPIIPGMTLQTGNTPIIPGVTLNNFANLAGADGVLQATELKTALTNSAGTDSRLDRTEFGNLANALGVPAGQVDALFTKMAQGQSSISVNSLLSVASNSMSDNNTWSSTSFKNFMNDLSSIANGQKVAPNNTAATTSRNTAEINIAPVPNNVTPNAAPAPVPKVAPAPASANVTPAPNKVAPAPVPKAAEAIAINNNATIWGDPHFVGADGEHYDVMGTTGKIYNILSDKGIQVNSRFDTYSGSATVMGQIGVTLGSNQILIDKNGTTSIDGKKVTNGTYLDGKVTVSGNSIVINDEEYKLNIQRQGGYLDIGFASKNVNADGVMPHGLWGQTADGDGKQRVAGNQQGGGVIDKVDGTRSASNDTKTVESYAVASIFDTSFANFNRFNG